MNTSQTSYFSANTKVADELKENIQIFNIISTDNPLIITIPVTTYEKNGIFSVAKHKSDKYLDISDFSASVIVLTQEQYVPLHNEELETNDVELDEKDRLVIEHESAIKQLRLTAYDLIQIIIPTTLNKEVYDKDGNPSHLVDIACPKVASVSCAQTPLGNVIIHNLVYSLTNNPAENIDIGQCEDNKISIYFKDNYGVEIPFEKPYSFRFKLYDVVSY